MNWLYKALLQAILSLMPFGEHINYKLQKMRGSNSPANVDNAFCYGIHMVKLLTENGLPSLKGLKLVEVGTGWLPTLPIMFFLLGAGKVYTFDHVRHLRLQLVKMTLLQVVKNFSKISEDIGVSVNELKERSEKIILDGDVDTLLRSMNIEYIAPGDASYTNLSDDSIDLFFSYAVLEHIPERIVLNITKEAFRTLKPIGLFYNLIGLHDHYVSFDKKISNINFLRYPEFVWKLLAKNKITYLNRLRNSQFIEIIRNCGFNILYINAPIDGPSLKVLKKMKIDKRFKRLELEDLAVIKSEIIAHKRPRL